MRPIGSIGWRTVVSGGSVQFMRNESSKPTIETSPGTLQPGALGGPDRAQRHEVAGAHDAGDARRRCRRSRAGLRGLDRVQERAIWSGPSGDPGAFATARAAASFRFDGTWSAGPSEQPIRVWPSESRWPMACSAATASSHETRGKPRPSIAALTRTVGSCARQSRVVAVGRVLPGRTGRRRTRCPTPAAAAAARRSPPRTRRPRSGCTARREALLRERAAHHLGEGREDRVLQLRQDEADEARPLAAELGRALVAQDVERGQDGLARGLGDAGLAVEHAADGRLAHADLLGHLGESSCHAVSYANSRQPFADCAQGRSRGIIWRMSLRHHEIAEANHRILDPLVDAQLRLIGEVTGVAEGTRVLDLACGKGELLCRWAGWFGSTGVGVDLSHVFLAAAGARASGARRRWRLTFVQGDAGVYGRSRRLRRRVLHRRDLDRRRDRRHDRAAATALGRAGGC